MYAVHFADGYEELAIGNFCSAKVILIAPWLSARRDDKPLIFFAARQAKKTHTAKL